VIGSELRETKSLLDQNLISSATMNKIEDLTSSRFPAWIYKSWALVCQLIPETKRENPLMSKLFSAMACPKTSIVELSHLLDQSGQARCHLRLSSLVVDERWEQMSVHPLRINMYINREPPPGRAFPAALEGSFDVILLEVATK
jgi:hypothetical protein